MTNVPPRIPHGLIAYIVAVIAIMCMCLMFGCVSIRTHEREVKASYVAGLQKARKYAAQDKCTGTVTLINKRLKSLTRDEIPEQ